MLQISYCGDNGDSQSTMRKLFDSAAVLFSKYEFDDVTVDAIVESAGVAKGTFYLYFKSKDALIAAFLLDYVSRLDAEYKRHLDSQPRGASASDLLLSLTEKIADMVTGAIGYNRMKTAYKVMLAHDVNMDTITGYNRFLYEISADVIRRGIENGELQSSLSPDVLARHYVTAIRGICYEWCIRYPDFDLKEHALTHVRIMLNGICAKPGSSL
ncbi:MAG TPA: TetR/AcrR family transcriptional regulator [Clostridiales bacterium]|nr:TetR/AcrR family transcriptional regulator [Clostridiales bacterium]